MRTNHIGKKVSYIGVEVALAMMVGYAESLIPVFFPIPGIKLGLANIVVVFVLYRHGMKSAFAVSTMRIIVSAFLFTNMSTLLYSLAGGMLSLLGMYFIKKTKQLSIIGVSVCGGVLHNVGQIMTAAAVVENFVVMTYLPVLIIVGIVTGSIIGIVAKELLKRIPFLN